MPEGIKTRILLLEDNPDDAELVRIELKKGALDSDIRHASSKAEFVKLVNEEIPDIILSDYNIPGYDIFRAIEFVRKRDEFLPFLVVTGTLGDEKAVDIIINHGVSDYILKDNLKRLNPSVEREINNAALKREQKKNLEEIRKLSLVASHTQNGVIITDKNGLIEWTNQAFKKLTGYSDNEFLGKKPGHLLQGQDTEPDTVKRISKALVNGESISEEILNYPKNKEPYWIKLDITPIKDEKGEVKQFIAIQENITERKRSELKTLESNRRLMEAQRIGKIGDFHFDIRSGKITWSDEIYKIWERDPEMGPPTMEELSSKYFGSHQTAHNFLVEKALNKGIEYDLNLRLRTDKGNYKYIHIVGIPITDNDGSVNRLMGVVQDITEKTHVAKEAESKQRTLSNITNNIDGLVCRYILHPDGSDEVVYISEGVTKLYGISIEQALENVNFMWDRVLEEDIPIVRKSLERSSRDHTRWDQIFRINTDNEIRHLQGMGNPAARSDGAVIWDILVLDITEMIRTRQELENTRIFQELAVEGAEVGLWEVDLDDLSTYYNPEYYKMLGYRKDEVIFKKDFHDSVIHPEDNEIIEAHMGKILSGKEDHFEEIIRMKAKDGTYRWILDRAKIVKYDEQGKPLKLAGSHLDITERVQAQKLLEESLNEKIVLISEIHHRVKNNLAIISSLLELQNFTGDRNESIIHAISRIKSIALVHEQLYNSDDLANIDLSEYYNKLIRTILKTLSLADTNITYDLNINVGTVNINQAIPLGLLLNELITNTLKYAFSDGKGKIFIDIKRNKDESLYFSYFDNGKGFDYEKELRSGGFGLELINTLLSQLEAEFKIESIKGFSLEFTFKEKLSGSHSNI